jgi:anaerobic selenocysteine-containing dehydrogenase
MIVESANPAHSLADSPRMREALAALDTVVVIDVAMTETARLADYVLPASSQYEKWEATFFNLEFPRNVFQLRAPIVEPLAGTLPEPEIHAASGALGASRGGAGAAARAAAQAAPPRGDSSGARGPKLGALARRAHETLGRRCRQRCGRGDLGNRDNAR